MQTTDKVPRVRRIEKVLGFSLSWLGILVSLPGLDMGLKEKALFALLLGAASYFGLAALDRAFRKLHGQGFIETIVRSALAPWLQFNQNEARETFSRYTSAIQLEPKKLSIGCGEMARESKIPRWVAWLLMKFPRLIPRQECRDAMERTLLLSRGSFEADTALDWNSCTERLSRYSRLKCAQGWTHQKVKSKRLGLGQMREVLKGIEEARVEDLRKRGKLP